MHYALALVGSPQEFLAQSVGKVVVKFLDDREPVGCLGNLHRAATGKRHGHTVDTHLNPLSTSVDGYHNLRVIAHHDGTHSERVRRDRGEGKATGEWHHDGTTGTHVIGRGTCGSANYQTVAHVGGEHCAVDGGWY